MRRTYVIGDIHGCRREFGRLLDLCSAHARGEPARLITLGDYVDRGPNSFGVVQLLRRGIAAEYPVFTSVIALKGNHEAMMAEAALGGDRRAKEDWVSSDNGGGGTVESYPDLETLRDDARWLDDLPTSFEDELRYYVHAGVRPGVALKDQTDTDSSGFAARSCDIGGLTKSMSSTATRRSRSRTCDPTASTSTPRSCTEAA